MWSEKRIPSSSMAESTSLQVAASRCHASAKPLANDLPATDDESSRPLDSHTGTSHSFRRYWALILSILAASGALMAIYSWLSGSIDPKPGAALAVVTVPWLLRTFSSGRHFQYTAWIIVALVVPLMYPHLFVRIGDFQLSSLIVPAVMFIMFAMGTQMSLADFRGIALMPKGVVVGLFAQFTIMPLLGAALARLLNLSPELAAGVILIGSCSSGLASNVMAYIAKANLALSITLTATATAIAPFITPLWMKLLVDETVPVHVGNMVLEILKLTIIPVAAGLLFNRFISNRSKFVDSAMPVLAMAGIVYYTMVTTALGRESLLQAGAVLICAAAVHNLGGYLLGYWLARLSRLDEQSCRALAFEVGMQNGGMAVGLAKEMNRLATVGLAAIVFSPWMNISGSILANYWRSRPVDGDSASR
jgi:bile acid:Na+ symporter, BASS family